MDDLSVYFGAVPRDERFDVCSCGHTREQHSAPSADAEASTACDVKLPAGAPPREGTRFTEYVDDCLKFVLAERSKVWMT